MLLHHVRKEFPYYGEKDSRVKLSFNDFSHLCMINPGIKVFFAMGMTVQFLAIYFYLVVEMCLCSATLCIRFTFRSVGGAGTDPPILYHYNWWQKPSKTSMMQEKF